MKKAILIPLLLLPLLLAAQTKSSTEWHYLEVIYSPGGFSSKQKVRVDTGDDSTGWFKSANVAKDENGKDIVFKSAVDTLNHFGSNGWELTCTYTTEETAGLSKITFLHFLLKHP